jgi:hypothetical protein
MVSIRKMEDSLLELTLVHRRDIPTVARCVKHGAIVNEFMLFQAHADIDMLRAIIENCTHVIKVKKCIILTVLTSHFEANKDKLWLILRHCKVSMGAGITNLLNNAVYYGDSEMVEFIVNNWDVSLISAVVTAAKACQYQILNFLLKKARYNRSTIEVALCDALSENVDRLDKTKQLCKIVALLMNNGAQPSLPLLKLCAFKSLKYRDFNVLITLLSFYDLKDVMNNIESYAGNTTSVEEWMTFVADAFRLQRAAKKIAHSFVVRRRLNLVRCIYRNKAVYSPSLVFVIAFHGKL